MAFKDKTMVLTFANFDEFRMNFGCPYGTKGVYLPDRGDAPGDPRAVRHSKDGEISTSES